MYPSMWHPKSIFTVSPAFRGGYFLAKEKIEIHEIEKKIQISQRVELQIFGLSGSFHFQSKNGHRT